MDEPKQYHAAIDLGASSGRVLLGWLDDGIISFKEVHRFDNKQHRRNGHDCWNVEYLFEQILQGLGLCKTNFGIEPSTIGVDTWGVDFVLLDKNDCLVGDTVAYRDARTQGAFAVADAMIDAATVYAKTGIQRQPFNTLYQLIALADEHPEQLSTAETFLMIPDYLNWRFTGVKSNEYTNATTTGMVNARTFTWDMDILNACGIPRRLFRTPASPGSKLGRVTLDIATKIGYSCDVILSATHDTGSAFLAVPAQNDSSVFISSGTWSLLGCENTEPLTNDASRLQNFTNEGGYGQRYRFLKNIMGLWMIQSVRRELNGVKYVEDTPTCMPKASHQYSFPELSQMAQGAKTFEAYVDVDEERFLAPESMIEEIKAACRETSQPIPLTIGELMRTIYCSLARSYAGAVANLSALTGRTFTAVNIVGGGCQDAYLNKMCAQACGLPVIAGPVEATGLGNLVVQMIYSGELNDILDARQAITHSFDVCTFSA